MSVETLCEHEVDIWRRREMRPAGKGARYVWIPPRTEADRDVACFVQPATAREITVAMTQKNYQISHVVWFVEDPHIVEMDRLEFRGRVLHVQAKPINPSEMDEVWKVDALETQWEQDQQDS